mgnify:CR=1 FL=1
MPESIYRIVHLTPTVAQAYLSLANNFSCHLTDVCHGVLAIASLPNTTFLERYLDEMPSLPGLSHAVLIILGGGILEDCVKSHRDALRRHGFTNLQIDPSLTVSKKDHRYFEKHVGFTNDKYRDEYRRLSSKC